jgi:hypothetical protein
VGAYTEIINRANLADSYIKERITELDGQAKYIDIVNRFRVYEKYAIENRINIEMMLQLDTELKMQATINEAIAKHTELTAVDQIGWQNELLLQSRALMELKAELEI